jgi:hypothetical protein
MCFELLGDIGTPAFPLQSILGHFALNNGSQTFHLFCFNHIYIPLIPTMQLVCSSSQQSHPTIHPNILALVSILERVWRQILKKDGKLVIESKSK